MQIKLTRGQYAIIDSGDWPIVCRFSWHATPAKMGGYYATTHVAGTTVYMHRLITGAPKGKEVDHRNHNTLDNRRNNLTVGSHKDNMANGKYALATHCPRGHPYNDANTYRDKRGRRCRECHRMEATARHNAETPEERQKRFCRKRDYQEQNRENIRAQNNLYASQHREKKREYDKQRRERLKASA